MQDKYFKIWVAETCRDISGVYQEPSEPVIPKAAPRKKTIKSAAYISGVYFLERNGVVVYIGQSGNVYSRITQHMSMASFEFDSFTIIACAVKDLLTLEARMIREYSPQENRILPASGSMRYESRARQNAKT